MPLQHITLVIGLALLLIIGAASTGLGLKSRSDRASLDRAIGMLGQIADVQPLLHRSENAARSFVLSGDQQFAAEYRQTSAAIPPALDALIGAGSTDPGARRVLEQTKALALGRIALNGELIGLYNEGDRAGVAALVGQEDRTAMAAIAGNLEKAASEARRLLATRRAESDANGKILLAIDLAGVALILVLATVVTRSAGHSRRELQDSLSATRATKEALEEAVAKHTEHLVEAHAELRLSAAVMRSTFDGMAEGVLVIDTRGEVLLYNPAAERMLRYRQGMTIRQLRRLSVTYYADGVTRMQVSDMPSNKVLRGEPFDEQEIVLRAEGRAPVHIAVSGRPLRDSSGNITGAALVYHDITASRETEHKLQQSQKLDAIGKLTGGVAHDFNNMLTVITGTTETLVAALKGQPSLQKTAELIDHAAERCRELIQHLLAFARKQPLQPRNVDINSTVSDITKLLRPTLGEQIEIDSVLHPDAILAHIDPSQLANSLLNLAINARDAMPDGGKLLLETGKVVLDEAYAATNPDVKPGEYVMLAVSDTGIGMSQAVLDKVFEPFFTTKEVGKGSGLGMSMVYGFVKQSGGHVKIYSEVGHGTSVKLYLPPAQGQAETVPVPAATLLHGNEIIMVVEDDPLVRNFVTTQLQSLGYTTVAAPSGPAAMAMIEQGEPFDLLFTDVIMPGGMTGRQLAEQAAKSRPGVKVLYTSGYTDNAIVHQGRLDPGVLLLSKPYRKSQLATMIRRALAGADK